MITVLSDSTAPLRSTLRPFAPATVLAALMLSTLAAQAGPAEVNLGSTDSFAVLAGAGITITGPTTITGDIGTAPNPAITGLTNVTLDGANHAGDAVTQLAKLDLVTAYNDAASRSFDTSFTGGFDLVGLTLVSGVYRDDSSLFLSGTLTLDAQGDSDAAWIFQVGSTLVTASDSNIVLLGGAQACQIFWQVGSSATLGTGTNFMGNILALTSDTLNTGATVDGRVFALNGAVTLDTNTVTLAVCSDTTPGGGTGGGGNGGGAGGGTGGATVPDTSNVLLLVGASLGTLWPFRRYFVSASRMP